MKPGDLVRVRFGAYAGKNVTITDIGNYTVELQVSDELRLFYWKSEVDLVQTPL